MTRRQFASWCLWAAVIAAPLSAIQQSSGLAQRSPSTAVQREPSVLPNEKGSVKFAVIGDTGTGSRQQYELATRLTDARARFPFEFVLMMGDNMYGGESPADFVQKFETPYKTLLGNDVKFYATLGNHDEPSQRYYKPFNMDGKRYYHFRKGDVEFFVLDSTYMTPAQVDWLRDALQSSDADWKIPYMHHPLYSSGRKHGSEEDLRALVEPLFVEHGVDIAFAGHEHFYERVKPQNGIVYITEGGSAKLREGNIRPQSSLTAKGFDTDQSFMLVEIVKDQMFFETIARDGRLVDSGVIPRREGMQPATTVTR